MLQNNFFALIIVQAADVRIPLNNLLSAFHSRMPAIFSSPEINKIIYVSKKVCLKLKLYLPGKFNLSLLN